MDNNTSQLYENSYSSSDLINYIRKTDILRRIYPELYLQKFCYHTTYYHPEGAKAIRKSDCTIFDYTYGIHDTDEYLIQLGTVFDHTLAALSESESTDPETNLCILFHDIGKPYTFKERIDIKKQIKKLTYYEHEKVGGGLFKNLCKRFEFSSSFIEKCMFCIEEHMHAHKLSEMKQAKVDRIKQHKYFKILEYIAHCDYYCRKDGNGVIH